MNFSRIVANPFSLMKIFFKYQLYLILLLTAGCVSSRERNAMNYPEAIHLALRRIPTIPRGMKEGQIFTFLGLSKPEEPFAKEIAAPFGETCTRYNIGFGDSFVLHCESIHARSSNISNYDNGVLFRVSILRLRTKKADQEPQYEFIPPEWVWTAR